MHSIEKNQLAKSGKKTDVPTPEKKKAKIFKKTIWQKRKDWTDKMEEKFQHLVGRVEETNTHK
jgi:hypothetical protein